MQFIRKWKLMFQHNTPEGPLGMGGQWPWSATTDRAVRQAGRRPGRAVPTEEWRRSLPGRGGVDMSEAARRFLAEFGGPLVTGQPEGSGPTRSRQAGKTRSSTCRTRAHRRISTPSAGSAVASPISAWPRGGTVYRVMDDVEFLAENGDEAGGNSSRGSGSARSGRPHRNSAHPGHWGLFRHCRNGGLHT
ncbi:SUKH-3 domain-containing protein [Streptomyces sp. NPDC006627]|uniref:SUKH-3 domain-containing protein n=1 Tax=Streptomyces sp. NPDC006627 TaxID=3154679 RepID=UPI0033A3AB7D